MSDYEAWLNAELAFRKQAILNRVRDMQYQLETIKSRVIGDGYLNGLGELQASGVMLDTAIAAYATERQALKNYQEMHK